MAIEPCMGTYTYLHAKVYVYVDIYTLMQVNIDDIRTYCAHVLCVYIHVYVCMYR